MLPACHSSAQFVAQRPQEGNNHKEIQREEVCTLCNDSLPFAIHSRPCPRGSFIKLRDARATLARLHAPADRLAALGWAQAQVCRTGGEGRYRYRGLRIVDEGGGKGCYCYSSRWSTHRDAVISLLLNLFFWRFVRNTSACTRLSPSEHAPVTSSVLTPLHPSSNGAAAIEHGMAGWAGGPTTADSMAAASSRSCSMHGG